MKRNTYLRTCLVLCGVALLLAGCLFKPKRVPTRTFILSPIASSVQPSTASPPPVEVALVKMPSYLLRHSMLVRKSANEVVYLDAAFWADRLDALFRQTLSENLSSLVPVSPIDHRTVRVAVDVKQFDVDTQGRGVLLADWKLTVAGRDKPFKSDESHLSFQGPAPYGKPETIARTMSSLTAEFSRQLARAIHDASGHLE